MISQLMRPIYDRNITDGKNIPVLVEEHLFEKIKSLNNGTEFYLSDLVNDLGLNMSDMQNLGKEFYGLIQDNRLYGIECISHNPMNKYRKYDNIIYNSPFKKELFIYMGNAIEPDNYSN